MARTLGTLTRKDMSQFTGEVTDTIGTAYEYDDPTTAIPGPSATGDDCTFELYNAQGTTKAKGILMDDSPDIGTVHKGTSINGLTVSHGQQITLKGCTVTGGITVDGGEILIKLDTSVTGGVTGQNGASITIDNSEIKGGVDINASASGKVKDVDLSGNLSIRTTSTVSVGGVTGAMPLNGQLHISDNVNVTVDGISLNGGNFNIKDNTGTTKLSNVVFNQGNLTITGNAGCTYKNFTLNGNNYTISGCTAV